MSEERERTAGSLAGERLWIGIPGSDLDAATRRHLQEIRPGGVILFARNCVDAAQITSLCAELRAICGKQLHVAVDQEGGRVVRIRAGVSVFPGNMALGAVMAANADLGRKYAASQGAILGGELRKLGIDVNLAPCVDVLSSRESPAIGTRSFGSNAGAVKELGQILLLAQFEGGVLSCLKHYPGLGRATIDPHHKLPHVVGLEPPEELYIHNDIAAVAVPKLVMSTHVVVEAYDRDTPATFSRGIINRLHVENRNRCVLMTDDLEMGALSEYASFEEITRRAVGAGHDVLCICSDFDLQRRAFQELRRAYDSSAPWVGKVFAIEGRLADLRAPEEGLAHVTPRSTEAAIDIARAALTLVRGDADVRALLDGGAKWLLLHPDFSQREAADPLRGDAGPLRGDVGPLRGENFDTLTGQLSARGNGEALSFRDRRDARRLHEILERGGGAEIIIVALVDARLDSAQRDLIEIAASLGKPAIFLLLGDPYDLRVVPTPPRSSVYTAYGFRPCQQQALGELLCGAQPAPGALPVPVETLLAG